MENNGLHAAVRRLRGFFRDTAAMRIPFYAAGAGYFMILAVFPSLVLLLGLLRFTDLKPENLMELLEGLIPGALRETAREFVANVWNNSSGSLVGLSAAAALWSAGRGIYGLMEGLNRVYGVRETRSWLATRLLCAAYTFLFFLVLTLTLVVHVFGRTLLSLLSRRTGGFAGYLAEVIGARFFLLVGLQTGVFALMFMALPNRKGGFRENLPGALLASAGWQLFSRLYSIYAEHFAALRGIYGPVYAVALSMLWLYFCLSIVFYGGALNRRLQSAGGK